MDTLSKNQQRGLLSIMQGKTVEWRTKAKRSGVDLTVRCVCLLNSSESIVTYAPLSDATLSIELDDAGGGNPQNAVKDRSMAERTIIHASSKYLAMLTSSGAMLKMIVNSTAMAVCETYAG